MKLVVPEEIDHIVKIAGACTLGQRADFLSEDFFVAIAAGMYTAFGQSE